MQTPNMIGKIIRMVSVLLIWWGSAGAQQAAVSVMNPEKVVIYSYIRGFQLIEGVLHIRDMYDTIKIQFADSLVMYRLPVRLVHLNREGITPYGVQFNYFVFKKGQTNGLLFQDTTDRFLPQVKNVDTITAERGYANTVQLKNVRFLSASKGKGRTLTEKYLPLVKRSEFTYDTVRLYYDSALVNSNYTLGPSLDSIKQSKLNGFVYSFKSYYSPTYKINMPPRDISLKFGRLPYTEADRLLADRLRLLFEKYTRRLH